VLSRIGGRLLVSPVAFFAAGVVDFSLFGAIYVRWRLQQRQERAARARGA
jgi:hypothetical protein